MLADFPTDTWVTYTTDHATHTGKAVIQRGTKVLKEITTGPNLPHNYALWTELDGNDVWIGTSKGLAHGIGQGYYPGLRPVQTSVRTTNGPYGSVGPAREVLVGAPTGEEER
ncbi:unnamed protein product [marine sediment metagenome]|uniref:Uncharacterized protein n=1 Tax=marine sediment metagenome TaxID=412755 RepID=X1JAS3_9ZZZZ